MDGEEFASVPVIVWYYYAAHFFCSVWEEPHLAVEEMGMYAYAFYPTLPITPITVTCCTL